MFLLNSRLGLFTATTLVAPLLPKLRGHFAEFLNKGSPVRLRILSSPTCVGLRYGHRIHTFSTFSRQPGFTCFLTLISVPVRLLPYDAYFTASQLTPLDRLYHQPAHAILLCQCFTLYGGTGISTSCPSPTTSVLGLGPDLPWADEPSPGNLGLSTCVFLAHISLLIPAFSLLCSPRVLTVTLLPAHYAPLPIPQGIPKLRRRVLAPVNLRRIITRPVSYYALFECVAASKPTSWLSVQLHILSHLTHTSGP